MMSNHKHIKSCGRLILLVALGSLLSLGVHGQELSDNEAETKASLELKLTSVTPSLCIDSPLKLELVVTNVSNEDVILNMSRLWSKFSFSFTGSADHEGKGGGMGIGILHMPDQNIVLHPGMTFQSTHEFALAFDFFQFTGNYTLKTQINSTFSNDVKFELYDCGKPQKTEDQQ